jgi:hypothetical protein
MWHSEVITFLTCQGPHCKRELPSAAVLFLAQLKIFPLRTSGKSLNVTNDLRFSTKLQYLGLCQDLSKSTAILQGWVSMSKTNLKIVLKRRKHFVLDVFSLVWPRPDHNWRKKLNWLCCQLVTPWQNLNPNTPNKSVGVSILQPYINHVLVQKWWRKNRLSLRRAHFCP